MNINASSPTVAQEALETAAQTKAEAAKGDMQAARKIAASQSQQAQAPVPSAPDGTGRVIDMKV